MSKYLSAGATMAILLLLAALGFQTYRIEGLEGDLELSRTIAANFLQTANQNAAVIERLKSDFNSSINACYQDIKSVADRFDRYRGATAKTQTKMPAPPQKTTTCEIGGANPLIDALNSLNKEAQDEREYQ
jgi:hypothetical protein